MKILIITCRIFTHGSLIGAFSGLRVVYGACQRNEVSILSSLSKKPAKLSSLSRELGITVQDVHRNLNRLSQEGLVKRLDGMFYVTEYSMVVMKQVPDLLVMKKNRKFF
ncbi:ArsR family transcriptional regulator [Candidatus Nitrososphaera gargensis]|uniref:ArsR family transcriptional regulator n=1 Tax=Candidatus Nitrososphaera gargensis TaxID=497727 RepID=UPI0011E58506|nr:winged helix-turn-helix domain-containing protein [Candidatus Nitrososphaera gargensis]